MHYDAYISREGKHVLAEFPDCPGCQTFADSSDEIAATAQEALEGWLEAHLVGGKAPPRPVMHAGAPPGYRLARIPVRAALAACLMIRWARVDRGITQGQLGKLAHVSQQQIQKLEDPDANPSIETFEKVVRALGLTLGFEFEDLPRVSTIPDPPRKVASRR